MSPSLDGLSRALGYRFVDPQLLQAAVTHRSAGSHNNERLEFLGDAVLGYIITEWLFQQFPKASEGQLSRLRASLVKRSTLAELARQLSLGDYLLLGSGELKSGGFRRDSILADAMEAIFGAVVLDSDDGLEQCRACIHRLFRSKVGELSPVEELKDPKTRLQEWLQARARPLPKYELVREEGAEHAKRFHVSCRLVDGEFEAEAVGTSRRKAEQSAASAVLEALQESRT